MEQITASPNFWIFATLLIFLVSKHLYNKTKQFFLFQPVLVSIGLLILILRYFDIPYETYQKGGEWISLLLGPTVVALGFPLYKLLGEIRQSKVSILTSILIGSLVGVVSGVVLALLFGVSEDVVRSLAPKSITTPIAMSVAEEVGGIPALSALTVALAGTSGALLGLPLLKLLKVDSPKAIGLAMGAASHGIGTAQAGELGEKHAAYGGVALALCGVLTAVVIPFILPFLIQVFGN